MFPKFLYIIKVNAKEEWSSICRAWPTIMTETWVWSTCSVALVLFQLMKYYSAREIFHDSSIKWLGKDGCSCSPQRDDGDIWGVGPITKAQTLSHGRVLSKNMRHVLFLNLKQGQQQTLISVTRGILRWILTGTSPAWHRTGRTAQIR